jgi:3',5'-cyclic-AMP phosphodiesterase
MNAVPGRRMTVLCGHTHSGGEAQVLPNLRVSTDGAIYGQPVIQRMMEVI